MNEKPKLITPEPRIVAEASKLFVGLKRRYNNARTAEIPAQWQAFQPYVGNIERQIGNVTFGVMCNSDEEGNIDYLTAVEVSALENGSPELNALRTSPQTYAVFTHEGHVSEIRRTWKAIFGTWSQNMDHELVDAPQFERYGENFDPETGNGNIEIWIPVH